MTRPQNLKKGDKIGIFASARKISMEEIQFAIETLTGWGLEVVLAKNLFAQENQFAGADKQRANDLQGFLDNDAIKAVICARGGYGTLRVIDQLDLSRFKKDPKWVIGYSDITVLHSHIHNLEIETIHATMPLNFHKDKEATESLRKVLFGEELKYKFPAHSLNRSGKANAEIVGGNLSLLYSLSGSVSDIDTEGKILFIEDLDEYYYHLDRMMMQLKRSGKLSGLAGLIVGGMTEMRDNAIPFGSSAEEIIMDAVKEYNYPVCFNFPAGHINKNMAIVLGRKINMEVSDSDTEVSY